MPFVDEKSLHRPEQKGAKAPLLRPGGTQPVLFRQSRKKLLRKILRIVRTRSAYDISWWLFGILAAGSALWLWCGITLDSLPLIATNVVTLTLQLTIFWLKWRYGRVPRRARANKMEELL